MKNGVFAKFYVENVVRVRCKCDEERNSTKW